MKGSYWKTGNLLKLCNFVLICAILNEILHAISNNSLCIANETSPIKKERFSKSKKPQLKPFHVIPPFMSKPPTPANSIDPRTTSWPIPGGHVPKKAQATTLCSTNRNWSRLCPGPFLFAPPKEKKNFVPFGMAEWERNKILQHPCPSFVEGQWDPRGNRSPGKAAPAAVFKVRDENRYR